MARTSTLALPRGVALSVAFVAGWVIMQLEILGGRVLAPWFGYSIYQWGALIGVVMTALAAGYWLGGRVGDRPRAGAFLLWALTVSALFIIAVPPFADSFLPAMRMLGPGWGAVAATAVLLGLPSVLLATTSPIVIRLTATELIARTAGRVYAISTVGSIAGTFFTAFYIIPELGSRLGHFVAAGMTIAAAAALALAARKVRALAVAALVGAGLTQIPPRSDPGVVYRGESLHNIITVRDLGNRRYLYLNYAEGAQTVAVKDELLTGSYYDFFLLGPRFNHGKKVLFLGSAGGTSLKQLVAVYPEVEVTGVELDPAVIEVANRYFGLGEAPRVTQVAADARWFLARSETTYDVIGIDLYVTGHVPFFTTTVEFFQLVYDRLADDGVMMMNILSMRRGDDLVAPFVRTVRAVFPSTFLISRGNYILVASKAAVTAKALRARLESGAPAPPALEEVIARALPTLRPASAGPEWPLFTDDRNDVEFRTFRMIQSGF